MPEPTRCEWAGTDPLMVAYHDDEWGVPTHDDAALFELLTLEGAQAGLSWRTILNKRGGYRAAFAGFDVDRVARFTDDDIDRLVGDASIVRHRGKIESTVANAKAIQSVQQEFGSFDAYVWHFVDGTPIVGEYEDLGQLPAVTDESIALSKDLKRRGFRFVGPTTVYAFMQAAGLVDDHVLTCFRRTGSVPERKTGSVPERETGSVPERKTGSVPERNTGR
jgi:DNA-3-methyladenine glycosylase I